MTKELKAWERVKRITSHREQGFSLELGEDYVYRNEVLTIEKALKTLEIIKNIFLRDLVFDDEKQVIKFSSGFSIVYIQIKDKTKYDLLKEALK